MGLRMRAPLSPMFWAHPTTTQLADVLQTSKSRANTKRNPLHPAKNDMQLLSQTFSLDSPLHPHVGTDPPSPPSASRSPPRVRRRRGTGVAPTALPRHRPHRPPRPFSRRRRAPTLFGHIHHSARAISAANTTLPTPSRRYQTRIPTLLRSKASRRWTARRDPRGRLRLTTASRRARGIERNRRPVRSPQLPLSRRREEPRGASSSFPVPLLPRDKLLESRIVPSGVSRRGGSPRSPEPGGRAGDSSPQRCSERTELWSVGCATSATAGAVGALATTSAASTPATGHAQPSLRSRHRPVPWQGARGSHHRSSISSI